MTPNEETWWIEAGLQCDGVELDDWEKEAIVRYGRLLTEQYLATIHDLRLENSAQAAIIERLNNDIRNRANNSN